MSIVNCSALLAALAFCAVVPAHADDTPTAAAAPSKPPVPDVPAAPDNSSSSDSAASTSSTSNVPDEVVAHSFRMVNSSGDTTLVMKNRDDKSPTMWFYDGTGQARIAVTIDSGKTPFIAFYDENGKLCMTAGYDTDHKDPMISLYDHAGTQRSTMSLIDDAPVFAVYRKDASLAASMEIDDDMGNVNVAAGDEFASMFSRPNGNVGFSLIDHKEVRGMFGLNPTTNFTGLSIGTGNGEEGITLMGMGGNPFIALSDQKAVRMRLSLDGKGQPAIDFNGKDGNPLISIPKQLPPAGK